MSSPSALLLVARSLLRLTGRAVARPRVIALGLGLGALGALFALLALLGPLALGVRLGVLLLELLERGGLGLGALARLVLAPLLLGLRLGIRLAGPALRGEGHPQPVEEGEGLLVAGGGGGDRHVEAADLVDRVVVDLGKDDLFAD